MVLSVKGPQAIKKEIYEYNMWQHNTHQLLVVVVWSDNNLMETLSIYHKPEIIHAGMIWRNIGLDGWDTRKESTQSRCTHSKHQLLQYLLSD